MVEEHKNSNNSPYKFSGKELDDETGNYYYGARYYNPKWSFWLSVDPLAEDYPGWSPYNYTLLNPVRLTDPTGMSAEDSGCGCPPNCPDDYQGYNPTVNVLFDNENNGYTPNAEKPKGNFFQRAFESVSNSLQSFSDYIERRTHLGEGLTLYKKGGHGSDGMYQFKGKRSVPVDVDEFLDNALMPGGSSSTSALANMLQLDATYFSVLSQADPLSNILNKGESKREKTNEKIMIRLYRPEIIPHKGGKFGIKHYTDTSVVRKDSAKVMQKNKRRYGKKIQEFDAIYNE